MIKFKVTQQLDFWAEAPDEIEYQLYYMNSSGVWESMACFSTLEAAKNYAALFTGVFKEEEFSI